MTDPEAEPCDKCRKPLAAYSVCNGCREEHEGHIPGVCPACKTDNLITVWGEDQLQRWRDGKRYVPDRSTDMIYDGARCDDCRGLNV